MSNLKFTLCVLSRDPAIGLIHLNVRVFDRDSLDSVHRMIQCGASGHYSKRRYFLETFYSFKEDPSGQAKTDLIQLYPNGGRKINSVFTEMFPRTSTYKR
jgi:hypothetical protein